MKDMESKLKAASKMLRSVKNDEDADKAIAEMQKTLGDCTSSEDLNAMAEFVLDEYQELNNKADELLAAVTLQEQLSSYKEILPMSYIARNYFGKSVAWLQQRINGYPVRGKIYTLKPSEVEILNNAIHDIGHRLGSLSVHC